MPPRSANSLSLRSPSGSGHPISPLNNMAQMRLGPQISAASPACLRGRVLLAGCGSGGLDRNDLRRAPKTARRRRRASSPRPKGARCRKCSNRPSPVELVLSPAAMVFYKGENRFPFGVFRKDRSQVDRRRSRPLLRHGARSHRRTSKRRKPRGRRRRARLKALEEPAVGPVPGEDRKPRDRSPPSRRQTTPSDPNAATAVYVDRNRLPQRRRMADRRGDQGRRPAERDRCCRA